MKTPPVGQMVFRQVDGEWIIDHCIMLRIDHGKPFPGAKKCYGEKLWIEYGIMVWRSDLARHKPNHDVWLERYLRHDHQTVGRASPSNDDDRPGVRLPEVRPSTQDPSVDHAGKAER